MKTLMISEGEYSYYRVIGIINVPDDFDIIDVRRRFTESFNYKPTKVPGTRQVNGRLAEVYSDENCQHNERLLLEAAKKYGAKPQDGGILADCTEQDVYFAFLKGQFGEVVYEEDLGT